MKHANCLKEIQGEGSKWTKREEALPFIYLGFWPILRMD